MQRSKFLDVCIHFTYWFKIAVFSYLSLLRIKLEKKWCGLASNNYFHISKTLYGGRVYAYLRLK